MSAIEPSAARRMSLTSKADEAAVILPAPMTSSQVSPAVNSVDRPLSAPVASSYACRKLSKSSPPEAAKAVGSVFPRKLSRMCRLCRSKVELLPILRWSTSNPLPKPWMSRISRLPGRVRMLQSMRMWPGLLPGLIVPAMVTPLVMWSVPPFPVRRPLAPSSNESALTVLLLRISVPEPPGPVGVAPTPT